MGHADGFDADGTAWTSAWGRSCREARDRISAGGHGPKGRRLHLTIFDRRRALVSAGSVPRNISRRPHIRTRDHSLLGIVVETQTFGGDAG